MEKAESTTVEIGETSKDKGETKKEKKGKALLLGAPLEIEQPRATRAKRGVAVFNLILRVIAGIAALAAAITMGTTQQTLSFFTQFFKFQANYDDLPAFTFFVVAMAIVSGYLILSVPLSIIGIARPAALALWFFLTILDTLALALATSASAASAAIVYLANRGNSDANWLPICQQFDDFCGRTGGAVAAAFVTVGLLVLVVVLSALALKRR